MISKQMIWAVLSLLIVLGAIHCLAAHAETSGCCESSTAAPADKNCKDPCTTLTDGCNRDVSAEEQAKVQNTMRYYCSAYSACSVDRDLRGATVAELKEYKKQKALDGKTFTNRIAPDFHATSTDGSVISLSQFRGKPVALLFLAVHCSHSKDTLPLLSALKKKYEPQGLVILPVYVHDGSIEDIKQFADSMKLDFHLLMVGKQVSNAFESRMVPTTFLMNGSGHIVREFVGFKRQSVLEGAFSQLLQQRKDGQQHASGGQ